MITVDGQMIVYALQYDDEDGCDRESWSVFYTPLEIFATKAQRDQRISDIRAYDSDKEFEERDIPVGVVAELNWKYEDG